MAHTLLCGQRRYTMPAVVLNPRTVTVDGAAGNFTAVALKLTNIRPPSGLVMFGAGTAGGGFAPRARFVTEKGTIIVPVPAMPTLFLSDGMIGSVSFLKDAAADFDFFSYWLVEDVSYLVEVREAFGG